MHGKIVFLTRSLNFGGAERQLVVLATGLKRRGACVSVVVFYSGGPLQAELAAAGVRVQVLGKRGRWEVLGFLARLRRVLDSERPDVLYSFLVVPNLLGALYGMLRARTKIVWGVRASNIDFSLFDWTAGAAFRLSALLARTADLIICNAQSGREFHRQRGYPDRSMIVIPNGIDTRCFTIDRASGAAVRAAAGAAASGILLLGVVARLDAMKGHATLIEAVALLLERGWKLKVICAGAGTPACSQQLLELCRARGVGANFVWCGNRADMPAVYNALDLLVLPSLGEGFPNVLGEAMACGVACVTTAVGDAAAVVGSLGVVVEPGNAMALAAGVEAALRRRTAPGRLRRHIEERFSVQHTVERTLEALRAPADAIPAAVPAAAAQDNAASLRP